MGAWSEGPTDNDQAQEWMANSIEGMIVAAIKDALQRFLEEPGDDVKKAEAEAAIALLVDLAGNLRGLKYVQFYIKSFADEQGLWDQAIKAIRCLQSEKSWLAGWSHPEKKSGVLNQLLADLESLKQGIATTEVQ